MLLDRLRSHLFPTHRMTQLLERGDSLRVLPRERDWLRNLRNQQKHSTSLDSHLKEQTA